MGRRTLAHVMRLLGPILAVAIVGSVVMPVPAHEGRATAAPNVLASVTPRAEPILPGYFFLTQTGRVTFAASQAFTGECSEYVAFCRADGTNGAYVTVTATVPEGWTFVGWQVCQPNGGSCDWGTICPGQTSCDLQLNVRSPFPPFGGTGPVQYRALSVPTGYADGLTLGSASPPPALDKAVLWVTAISDDARYVVYVGAGDGHGAVWWQDRTTGEAAAVLESSDLDWETISMSPDGRYVFTSAGIWDSTSKSFGEGPTPPSPLPEGVCDVTPDGRYELRVDYSSPETPFEVRDTSNDSVVVIPGSVIGNCMDSYVNRRSFFARISSDGTKVLFVCCRVPDTYQPGPLSDGSYDYLGIYLATINDGTATLAPFSGATIARPDPTLNFSSVATNPDFSQVVFTNESRLLASTLTEPTEPAPTGPLSRQPLATQPLVLIPRVLHGTRTNKVLTRALTVSHKGSGTGTVTSDPIGIACGSTCTEQYADKVEVKLTAVPDDGSLFVGWSGACAGTGTCTVTMDQARTVTALFASRPAAAPRNTSVKVSWSAAAWPSIGKLTGFQVQRSSDGGITWKSVGSARKTNRSLTATRLKNGVEYRFRVRAVRGRVAGDWFETDAVTPRTVPGQVRTLTVLPGDGTLTASWFEPSSNGGAPITGYRIQTSTNGRTWSAATTVAADVLATTITGLTNGLKRYVRVIAINAAGPGKARVSLKTAPALPI